MYGRLASSDGSRRSSGTQSDEGAAMNRTALVYCFALSGLAVFALASCSAASAAEATPPNVVFFLVDDLGQRDLGCYGSSFYETPHLDQLAADGIQLNHAYAACPVCSPTRASILTGQYPQRTGITDYIGAAQPDQWKRNTRHLPARYTEQLALEKVTLAEVLKSAGYSTFFAGKWHLGGEGFSPEKQGFEINMGGLAAGGPYGGKKYFSPYGNPKLPDGPEGEHLPDRLASEAVRFIEQNQSKPFFVYFPFYSVHTPLMSRPDLQKKYEAKRAAISQVDVFGDEQPRKVRLSQDHAIYSGMVEAMDEAVGKVLASLDALKLSDRTLVIFTSDNGGLSTSEGSPTSNSPLRAGKGWLYEGGIRTACIARWPGVIPAHQVSDVPVISPDYYPTILEAVGIDAPEEQQLDGVSVFPTLQGKTQPLSRSLFWQYPHYGNQGGAPGAAVRDAEWKLIEWFDDARIELFDLSQDPGETTNLAARFPDRVAAMRSSLHAWQADVGAKVSTVNPSYDSAKPDGRR
jgi:arylsulfatase A-like enzyme